MVILNALLRFVLAIVLALLGWIPLTAAVPSPALLDEAPVLTAVVNVVSAVTGSPAVGGGDEVVDDVASGDEVAEDAAAEGVVDDGTGGAVVDDAFGDEVVDDSFGDEALGDAAFEDPVDTVDPEESDVATGDGVTSGPDSGVDDGVDTVDDPAVDDPAVNDSGDSGGATTPPTSAGEQSDLSPTATADKGTGARDDGSATEEPSETTAADSALPPVPLVGFRLDDSVLQWLPELNNASVQTGIPIELLAALMRTTSNGQAGLQTTDGRFGLLFVQQRAFDERRIADELRNDPQINTLTGAEAIARIGLRGGTFDAALTRYFGSFCDASGACTRDYIEAINGWTEYYAALFADSSLGGLAALPDGYVPGLINAFVVETLDGLEFPAASDTLASASTGGDVTVSATTPVAGDASTDQATEIPPADETTGVEPAPAEPTVEGEPDRQTRRDRRAAETPAAGG